MAIEAHKRQIHRKLLLKNRIKFVLFYCSSSLFFMHCETHIWTIRLHLLQSSIILKGEYAHWKNKHFFWHSFYYNITGKQTPWKWKTKKNGWTFKLFVFLCIHEDVLLLIFFVNLKHLDTPVYRLFPKCFLPENK